MFVGKTEPNLEWSTWKVLHLGKLRPYPQTRLERLAKDKRSSLLWKVVNYGRKSFLTSAQAYYIGLAYGQSLSAVQLYILSMHVSSLWPKNIFDWCQKLCINSLTSVDWNKATKSIFK